MAQDILISDGGELRIAGGDFVVGQSDAQHGGLLLRTHPGEWRQWPLVGVGLATYLGDDAAEADIRHAVTVQAEYDGAIIDRLTVTSPDTTSYEVDLIIRYP